MLRCPRFLMPRRTTASLCVPASLTIAPPPTTSMPCSRKSALPRAKSEVQNRTCQERGRHSDYDLRMRAVRYRRVLKEIGRVGQFFVLLPIMLVLAWFNPADYQSQLSQLSPGTLSGNTYTNGAVGVSYEVPQGWTSTPDPSGPARIDPRHPESPMNQCTKV